MTASAPHDWALVSRRTSTLLLILALHALLIYGFATGLTQKLIQVLPPAIQTVIEDQPRTREPPPPPSGPRLTEPHEVIPWTDVKIAETPEENTIHEVEPEHSAAPPTVAVKAPIRVLGGPGKGFPNTDDYYPPASVRLGEEGSASVRVCVDDQGRLAAAPTIAESSGSERLDEGALKLAKAGSGHYRATLEDGQPVSSCYAFRVRFVMRN
jgi:protein TonB